MAMQPFNPIQLSNPIIVALDVDSRERCLALARQLKGRVGAFKLGPRLLVRYGAPLAEEISQLAPVFIDNKYLDIPNTMEHAVRASFDAGATLVTVHAWAGSEALRRLAEVERELNQRRPFQILVVTVLTSFSRETLPPPLDQHPIDEQVRSLGDLTFRSGLNGLVCSPEEVADLRQRYPHAFLLTPGIRLPEDAAGDQKRVTGPREALAAGATALVVGRPIVEASSPVAAADRFLDAIEGFYEKRS